MIEGVDVVEGSIVQYHAIANQREIDLRFQIIELLLKVSVLYVLSILLILIRGLMVERSRERA